MIRLVLLFLALASASAVKRDAETSGACCFALTCISPDSTAEECVSQYSGTFAGVGSDCSRCALEKWDEIPTNVPTPMPTVAPAEPSGACCHPNGCMQTTIARCSQVSHVSRFMGYDTLCSPLLCVGGCCANDDAICVDGKKASECVGGVDAFIGYSTTCATTSSSRCGGACCAKDGSACRHAATFAQCVEDFKGVYAGDGVSCSSAPCSGSCCLSGNACVVSGGESQCLLMGGLFKGVGSNCGSYSGPDSLCYVAPTSIPTAQPTAEPTPQPTANPTAQPTQHPTAHPTARPTRRPTSQPTRRPTARPTENPTPQPTPQPTQPLMTRRSASLERAAAAQLEILSQQCSCNASSLVGACCNPSAPCVHLNPIDCALGGGFYRGSNTTCSDVDICAQCLPCILEESETGFCPLRLYHSFASDSHRYDDDSSSSSSSSSKHSHDIHHRNDACQEPQICATNYGRCLIPAVQRRGTTSPSAAHDCGGADTLNLECSVELGSGRCGVGVCAPDPQYGAYGQMTCVDIREFPCGCQCYDEEAVSCGAAKGVIFDDINKDGVQQSPGEICIAGAQVGIWLDDSAFTVPPTTPPIAVRVTDEQGVYVFNSLRATRYHIVVLSLPPPYVTIPTTPAMHTVDIECPGHASDSSDDDSSSSSSSDVNVIVYHSSSSSSSSSSDESSSSSSSSSSSEESSSSSPTYHRRRRRHISSSTHRLIRAGGELSSVQRSAHLDLDNNFGVGAAFSVSGRVVRDANSDNIAQLNEVGIGHAKIRAKIHPTMHVVATVESSVGDGSFSFPMLPEGVYDFEEVDPRGYMSTGDSSGANDNVIPNVVVSHSLGDIVSCSVAIPSNSSIVCIDFFDVKIGKRRHQDDDDDDDNDSSSFSHCHNPLTWWLHSNCLQHVWEEHITLAGFTILLFIGLCFFIGFCTCLVVFGSTKVRRPVNPRPPATVTPLPPYKPKQAPKPAPKSRSSDDESRRSELGNSSPRSTGEISSGEEE